MGVEGFISKRIKFDGKAAVTAIAISSTIIIVSLAVSAGFRSEIRKGISAISGDIVLSDPVSGSLNGTRPIPASPSFADSILAIEGVEKMEAAVYRAGVIKTETGIKGVMFKGIGDGDTTTLGARIPAKTARELNLREGDNMTAYFVGTNVRARNFTVTEIWNGILDTDDALVIYTRIEDLRRVNGWGPDDASVLEISLDERYSGRKEMESKAREAGDIAFRLAGEDETVLMSRAATERFPQLFDWISLIHVNVLAILALMITVAGFNMISGLLIMLFRSSPMIGILKTMGMTDRQLAGAFLGSAAKAAAKGLAIGNAVGIILCIVQKYTQLIKLNPDNYFLSSVPIRMEWPSIILADAAAFFAIMLLLAIPAVFISKVDPAKTVRNQ